LGIFANVLNRNDATATGIINHETGNRSCPKSRPLTDLYGLKPVPDLKA
jgi:hypothetical protein